jgi:branched-chain amino acid transport system substrate-binding protein
MLKTLFATTALVAVAVTAPAHAQTKEPLKIGVLMPTTGVFAVLGLEQLKGMRYAVAEAGGEVAGRKIELIIEDDQGAPGTGLTKARKLVTSDNVDVTAGIVSSAVALAVIPYLASVKMPLVISNATTDELSGAKCSPYVFRTSYSSSQMSEPLGDYMGKKGIKTLYLMAADYVAPREHLAAVRRTYLKQGGKIIGESYPPFAKTQDYGPYIAQARSSGAQALLPIFYASEAILFMKQYSSFGLQKTLPVYGSSGLVNPVLLGALGDAALGVDSVTNYVPEIDTPENKSFVENWRKAHAGNDPEDFAVTAYDSIRFILEAVKALNGNTKDRDAFAAAISKVKYNSPRGPISIGKTNTVSQNIYIARTVKRGEKIGYEILDTYKNFEDPVEGCNLRK